MAAQEVVRSGVSTASDLAQRTTDQVTEALGAVHERSQNLTERTTQNLQAVTRSSVTLARGMQDASGECLEMIQERLQKNLDGLNALARCRTLPEFLAAQSSLVRDNLEMTLTNSRRLAELSTEVAGRATQTVTAEIEQSARRAA
jgi:phasin family protein